MRNLIPSSSYSDNVTAASGTAPSFSSVLVPAQTIKALNTGVTTSSASSLLIQGPPIAGQNQSITNAYSLFIQSGSSKLAGPLILSQNNTANTTSLIASPSISSNYTLTLPSSTPTSAGQALLSDVNGVLTWGSAGSAATQSTFSGANNVAAPTAITGLMITAGPVVIPVYVYVNATTRLAALVNLNIYSNPTTNGYNVDGTSIGDNTLVKFSIDSSGQLYYTSGSYTGFTSLTFAWFSPYTPVASVTSSLALAAALSVGTTTSLATNAISGTPSATTGNLVNVNGSTFTDISTAASGTAAAFNGTYVAAPTLKATNTSVITTSASSLFIQGPPIAGQNQTITNAYALNIASGISIFSGPSRFPGGIYDNNITNQPLPQLRCSASFYVPSGGTAVVINSSYNVASITRSSAGIFQVNFIQPMKNTTYVVTTGFSRVGNADFINVFGPSVNSVSLELISATVDKDPVNVMGIMFTVFN